jgi:hypothetical protein
MLEYEAKVLDAMDVREAIVKIMENQERLGEKLQAITEEIKRMEEYDQ